MANSSMANTQVHIAILPTPGMGHLIPLLNFAKTLHFHHNITSTIFIPSTGPLSPSHKAFLLTLPPFIDYVLLPSVNFDDLPKQKESDSVAIHSLTITRSLHAIRSAFKTLHETKNVAALVVDLFGTDGFEVALEFNIPKYIFFPSNAFLLSLIFHIVRLDETVPCEYRDLQEKIELPGCVPINGEDLVDPVQDRGSQAYKWFLHHANKYELADGILINTFKELENNAIVALEEKLEGKTTIRPIGPLVQMDHLDSEASGCLAWLDKQPSRSVLFVSFGSRGTMSYDQIVELATGLEMSEQRFLWVLRCPNDKVANANYFSISDSDDPLAFLPEGFLDRTRDRGFVVPLWAPQAQILAHKSTGGFLSHCGWNSTLESVVSGLPMITWPLYAEQRMNAVLLHEDIKVALRPKGGKNELVKSAEIVNVVKGLMGGEEGREIHSRVRELQDAAATVLGENGSSRKALAEFACELKNAKK